MYTSPRLRNIAEAASERERFKAELAANEARRLVEEPNLREAISVEAAARELADELFYADPEVKALREEYEATTRRVQAPIGRMEGNVLKVIADTKASLKKGASVLATAAFDDAMDNDFAFTRARAVQARIDDDRMRLEMLESVLHSIAYSTRMTHRMQEAKAALDHVLLTRKRQHARELAAALAANDVKKGQQAGTSAPAADVVEL